MKDQGCIAESAAFGPGPVGTEHLIRSETALKRVLV